MGNGMLGYFPKDASKGMRGGNQEHSDLSESATSRHFKKCSELSHIELTS